MNLKFPLYQIPKEEIQTEKIQHDKIWISKSFLFTLFLYIPSLLVTAYNFDEMIKKIILLHKYFQLSKYNVW